MLPFDEGQPPWTPRGMIWAYALVADAISAMAGEVDVARLRADEALRQELAKELLRAYHRAYTTTEQQSPLGERRVELSLRDIRCPVCGRRARGTAEVCVALFREVGLARRAIVWEGCLDTEDSTTLYREGLPVLVCEEGHQYVHALFTSDELRKLD